MSNVNDAVKMQAFDRVMQYVNAAMDAVNGKPQSAEDTVMRLVDGNGNNRRVEACTTDSIKSFGGKWIRSGAEKHLNNDTRNDFKESLLELLGKKGFDDIKKNLIGSISKKIYEALESDNFNHGGHPLSARRILKVAVAAGLVKKTAAGKYEMGSSVKVNYARRALLQEIVNNPEKRHEYAEKFRKQGGWDNFSKEKVDLELDKAPCRTMNKLCAIDGDTKKIPEKLKALGFKGLFIIPNYADSTWMGGEFFGTATSQEESVLEQFGPEAFAFFLEEGVLKVGFDSAIDKVAFEYTNPLNGGLCTAGDPYIMTFTMKEEKAVEQEGNQNVQREVKPKEVKTQTVINMAMPALSNEDTGFDRVNYASRIVEVRKNELAQDYDNEHKGNLDAIKAMPEGNDKKKALEEYCKAKENYVKDKLNITSEKEKTILEYTQNLHINIRARSKEKIAGTDEKKMKADPEELRKIVQFAGSELDGDPFGDNYEKEANKAIDHAVKIYNAHKKALEKGVDSLSAKEKALDAIYKKANTNYEKSIYNEYATVIIRLRKAGVKVCPIGLGGLGVFGNKPGPVARMAAMAFRDFGGDMIPLLSLYGMDVVNKVLGNKEKTFTEQFVNVFNDALGKQGDNEVKLDINDFTDTHRLEEVAEEFKTENPDVDDNVDVQQNQASVQNPKSLLIEEEGENGEIELGWNKPQGHIQNQGSQVIENASNVNNQNEIQEPPRDNFIAEMDDKERAKKLNECYNKMSTVIEWGDLDVGGSKKKHNYNENKKFNDGLFEACGRMQRNIQIVKDAHLDMDTKATLLMLKIRELLNDIFLQENLSFVDLKGKEMMARDKEYAASIENEINETALRDMARDFLGAGENDYSMGKSKFVNMMSKCYQSVRMMDPQYKPQDTTIDNISSFISAISQKL